MSKRFGVCEMARRSSFVVVVLMAMWVCTLPAVKGHELIFVPVKIDGPVHDPGRFSFWFGPFAECSSVLDINKDGRLDIAAGRNYYIAPDWKKYADYREGAATNGPDVDDNFEGTMVSTRVSGSWCSSPDVPTKGLLSSEPLKVPVPSRLKLQLS